MTKRRGNGEGSVYRRGDGRVVGEYEDANGKRRYVSGKTRAEMRRKLRGLLADRDEGVAYDSESLTVGAYLDRWLDAVKGSVRQRTWERHEQVVRLHLRPTLGNVRLDTLNAMQVQTLYGQKLEAGLSPRTVEIVHATLHKALKQAVGWTLIPRNVAEAATPPRPVGREIRPLSREQARALLNAAKGDALEAFYVLAVTTGMRNGELLGLQWRDVDLDAGTLRVRRSVFKGAVNPPKTKAGNRTICLTGMAVAALEEHRGAATREGGDPQWVFPSRAGTPLSVHNVHNRSWKPLLGRAGLPLSTRMHDLRHTCATLLLREGVPVKVVSEMLGHGDVAITLAVYQSVLPEVQRRSGRLPGLVCRLHPLAWIDFAPVQDHRRFQVRSHGPKLQVPEDKVRVDVFGERLLLSVLADVQHDTQEHRLVAPIPSGEGVIPAPSRLPVPALNPLGDVRLG